MEGDGMVAVVRGLREAGLAVTLLDGNRQYTLLPNTTTQPTPTSATPPKPVVHVATQQCPPKITADTSTEPAARDRDAQAIDGRYASMYKTMHCNMRPTSPPVELTEFPPQRPDLYPGHGNFIVGGSGSGANGCPIRPSSPINSFRGGMSWPDRGSVCSPQPSRMEDTFARSLRKYPNCLSPDRSSEVMERLVNYSQAKGSSRNYCSSSPNRSPEPSFQTFNMASRSRSKNKDPPARDRRNDGHSDRPVRGCYEVRHLKDITKKMREAAGRPHTTYPYSHPVRPPTIKETHDYHPLSCDNQNSSNSVNMEIQAAVKMLSKEVETVPRVDVTRKTVAVPESPISSAGEDYVEGEFYYVENMDIRTSIKSIQTNCYPSDTTLKPRKSAQTVFSTIDFHSSRNRTIVSRKTKSQEAIKLTKDELKISLLELINEISDTVSKNTIRDELIKKLFDTSERTDHICDRAKMKHDKSHKYVADYCPTVCDYVGDYQDLVGKLKHCYGNAKNVLRSEIKPFTLSEYRQLDFVLKDWVNHLNLKTDDIGRSINRRHLLNSVENRIKRLLKNWTKEDFDLKSKIVEILQEIPVQVNKSYGMKSYLRKLVDVLLKRLRNVIVTEQTGRVRRRSFASRSKKILTEEDMRDIVRKHLLNYANENNSIISNEFLMCDLENELVDLMMDSAECIWRGHDDEILDEMEIILQDLGKISNKHANYISNLMLQDLQDMLNNCVFNQSYTILNVSNNSGQYMNSTNNTDFSIGSITEEDLEVNLDLYTNQLCLQINQWLDDLNILQIEDNALREVVVNDLAGDIIDRQRYVELNHTGRDSDQDQLEALKYQIFKWINKLVGDDNQETINHAENLLQRINSVPVPMLVNPKHCSTEIAEVDNRTYPNAGRCSQNPCSQPAQSEPCCGNETCSNTRGSFHNAGTSKPLVIQGQTGRGSQTGNASHPQVRNSLNNSRAYGRSFDPVSHFNTFSSEFIVNLTQSRQDPVSGGGMGTCANPSTSNHPGGSVPVKKLNEDYDEYLKQWVKKIPIADKTVEESARLNVYNGIWKAVTKMKLDPNIFGNYHYCQDVIAEEVETLLQDVPQSQELEQVKPVLKAQLLQKTLAMNDLIKSTNAPASFKLQLMDNIENNLPKRTPTDDEEDKANDDLDKQNMADYYILFTRYKDEDNVKANIHRKNFLKKLDEYINKIKNRHNLVDMETMAYANEIINSLEKIPTPNHWAIKDEADEILLAMEVENWIFDIPQNIPVRPVERRRTREAIVKKIQEIGLGGVSCCDNTFRVALKTELPKTLEKMPIQEGTNKNYLIDELANRIKNLSTSITRRVSFEEPEDFEEFSRNMPFSSSMYETTGDRSSNLITGENIVKCSPRQSGPWAMDLHQNISLGAERQPSVLTDDIQWLPLDKTDTVPSPMRSGYVAPQSGQSLHYHSIPVIEYNPNELGQMSQRPQSPQMYTPDCCALPGGNNVSGVNISRDAVLNGTCGGERAPVPQKRQKMSMQESQVTSCARNNSGRPESARSQLFNPNDSLVGRSYPSQGNIGTDAGLRLNWAGGQRQVPEKEIQWYSMEMDEIPAQMPSISIEATQRSYPGRSQVQKIFTPNTQSPYVPFRTDVPFSSFPKAGHQSYIRNNLGTRLNWGGRPSPIPEEDTQRYYTMVRTEVPSQIQNTSIPTASPCARSQPVLGPNLTDQANQRSYPRSSQVPIIFTPNTQKPFFHATDVPFSSINQSQLPRTTQGTFLPNVSSQELCAGPPCCPNPICNDRTQGSPGMMLYSQPAPPSPGPRGSYGQGPPQGLPNVPSSPCGSVPNVAHTSPLPHVQFGQGSPGRVNQSVGPAHGSVNIQNGSLPGGQIVGTQVQHCQKILNQPPPFFGPGVGPLLPNNTLRQRFGTPCGQLSLGPGGQMPCPGGIAPQLGQALPNTPCNSQNGQAFVGVIGGSGQVFSNAPPNACQGQAILIQTLQNPGPLTAANQVHEQAERPVNLKMMVGGQMGIFSRSQLPGLSSEAVMPMDGAPNSSCNQIQQPSIQNQLMPKPSNQNRIMPEPSNVNQLMPQSSNQNQIMPQPTQNRIIQQPLTTDKKLQAACLPAKFLGRPKGCFGPDRDRERERCKCMRRRNKFRPRMLMDPNDNLFRYLPCRSRRHYPCFY